jgi:hypothetical protein
VEKWSYSLHCLCNDCVASYLNKKGKLCQVKNKIEIANISLDKIQNLGIIVFALQEMV